jgi:hypothetical protein
MPKRKTVTLNATQIKALELLIDYNWKDELRDYEEHFPEEIDGHIFTHMVMLDNLIHGTTTEACWYVTVRQAAE